MTLNDAFSVLIAQPFWYKGSGYTKQYAMRFPGIYKAML